MHQPGLTVSPRVHGTSAAFTVVTNSSPASSSRGAVSFLSGCLPSPELQTRSGHFSDGWTFLRASLPRKSGACSLYGGFPAALKYLPPRARKRYILQPGYPGHAVNRLSGVGQALGGNISPRNPDSGLRACCLWKDHLLPVGGVADRCCWKKGIFCGY